MKNKTDNTAKKSNLKRFASYYRPHIGMFTVDMLCALFISSVDIAYPLLSKLALDRYLSATAPQYRPFFILMAVFPALYPSHRCNIYRHGTRAQTRRSY